MSIREKVFLFIIFQGLCIMSDAQQWSFSIPSKIYGLLGTCVEIPCIFTQPINSNAKVVWYSRNRNVEVLNSHDSSMVQRSYRGRTSLVKDSRNSCTLRINKLTKEDFQTYFPGIHGQRNINSLDIHQKTVQLHIIESLVAPELLGPGEMTEGSPVDITCSALYSCPSSPPSIMLDITGKQVMDHKYLEEGIWISIIKVTYRPSHEDHQKIIQCTAIYANGQTSMKRGRLNIKYPPKNTQVDIIEKEDILEGDDVTLFCLSNSNPDIQFHEWYKGKQKLAEINRQITVRNVTWDSEPYSCSAANSLGKEESVPTEIPVQYAAKEVHLIINETGEGYTELKCEYLSSRPNVTYYTWIRDETILINQTQQILKLENTEIRFGKYQCVAHNKVGNVSSSYLQVHITPEVSPVDLPLVLGCLAAFIVFILLVLVFYFCKRKREKKAISPVLSSNGIIPTQIDNQQITNSEYISVGGHLYENLVEDKSGLTNSTKALYSKGDPHHLKEEDTIYSNVEHEYPEELQYSSIKHFRPNGSRIMNQTEATEYATVIHN
ncbi:sialoadhesin-like [Discoglossus pictus]